MRNIIKACLILLISIIVFSGCTKNNPNFSNKEYSNINKNIVLNAAKKVLNLADKRFTVHSYESRIQGRMSIAKHRGTHVDVEINTINLEVQSKANKTLAKLIIKRQDDYFDKNKKNASENTHLLLWDRIDYILGLKDEWATCTKRSYLDAFNKVLCDNIYIQNNNPKKSDLLTRSNYNNAIQKNNSDFAKINLDGLKNYKLKGHVPNKKLMPQDVIQIRNKKSPPKKKLKY